MLKIDWHSNKTWGIAGTVIAFITLLLGMILQPYFGIETQARIWAYVWKNALGLFAVLLILVLVALALRQDRKLRAIKKIIATEEKPKFARFEDIKQVKFGYVAYRPLLYYDQGDSPQGIGITLLNLIFEDVELIDIKRKALWSDLIQNLAGRKYDIIATPIFETRERSRLISFCSPVFYSDIGMYVKKDAKVLGHLSRHSQTFKEAVDLAQRLKPKLVAIEGEISGKMAKKYLIPKGAEVTEWLQPETASVNSLISALNDGTDNECELAFAETFQAEHTASVRAGEVVNILKPKELTYPVSFAVRKSDYVLKNYVNLKLLQIDKTVEHGVLGIILRELTKHPDYSNYSLNDIKKFFIRALGPDDSASTGGLDPAGEKPIVDGGEEGAEEGAEEGRVRSITDHKRKANGH